MTSSGGYGRAEPRQTLHDFQLLDKIGEGGSAEVHRARNTTFDVIVALKLWREPLTADQSRKFLDECRLHFRLSEHPNIVRLYWAESPAGERAWLATELHDASLADRMSSEPPPTEAEAYAIADDILAGLAAIQELGHVHRDVKPANVLLKNSRAALCDMGIAMQAGANTRDVAAGTFFYTAPELGTGATPNYRSDVYSAALTIRALLPQPRRAAVDALLTRAASINPDDRPRDAAEFRQRLTAAQPDRPAPPQPVRRLLPSAPPRHRWRFIGLLAAAATLAVGYASGAILPARPGASPSGLGRSAAPQMSSPFPSPAMSSNDLAASSNPAATGSAGPTGEPTRPSPTAVRTTTKPGPTYVSASGFTPFGASYASFTLATTDTRLTVGSPISYDHLWGAWLPGTTCSTTASFDIKLDAPTGSSPGYGYGVAPLATITNDQPVGWSMQHEWDGTSNGFFTRPVLLPGGASAGGGSVAAPDVRTTHHVEVSASAGRYSVTIDGTSRGSFSGSSSCGGLAIRVWGGATAHLDHLDIGH